MFCPKCGNSVPDGAAFCGVCGNSFAPAQPPAGNPVQATPSAGFTAVSQRSMPTMGYATIGVSVLALIFTLFAWIELPSIFATAFAQLNSASSALIGQQAYNFQSSFAPWDFLALSNQFNSLMGAIGSYSEEIAGFLMLTTVVSWLMLLLWLACVVLIVWGSINLFLKRTTAILRAGLIVSIVTVAYFIILVLVWNLIMSSTMASAGLGGSTALNMGFTLFPFLCLICAIAALVCMKNYRKTM